MKSERKNDLLKLRTEKKGTDKVHRKTQMWIWFTREVK